MLVRAALCNRTYRPSAAKKSLLLLARPNTIVSYIPAVIVLLSPLCHSPTHPCTPPLQEDTSLILSTSAFPLPTWLDALLLTLFVFLKCFPVPEVHPHHLTKAAASMHPQLPFSVAEYLHCSAFPIIWGPYCECLGAHLPPLSPAKGGNESVTLSIYSSPCSTSNNTV